MKTTIYIDHLKFEADEQAADLVALHLETFVTNFRQCFGIEPTHRQLQGAFRFMDAFFKEINETYPGSVYEKAIQRLEFLVKSDPVQISERIAQLGSYSQVPSAAVWYE